MSAAYLRRLGMIGKLFNVTPEALAKKTVKEATDFLLDIVSRLDVEGKQPGYIKSVKDAINSWFAHNEIHVTKRIKMPDAKTPSKVSMEQSPQPDDFKLLLNVCDLKAKVACTLIAFAGLRLEVMGNYLGTDGLKVKDLPEMKIVNGKVEFARTPTMILIRAPLSKARHQYFTFYPIEGCVYLKQLLEARMSEGEVIKPDSPIYANRKGTDMDHTTTKQIGKYIKSHIIKAGFDWRPYILRTYFATRLMLAEADGLIIRDWRVFFMGHKGDIEHTYTLNKGKVPEDLLEKMREKFDKSAEKHLVTYRTQDLTKDTVIAEINKRFLRIAKVSPDEIEKLGDLSLLSEEDMTRLLDSAHKKNIGLNGNSQKIVPRTEVKDYIMNGWELVDWLTPEEAIIRLPKS